MRPLVSENMVGCHHQQMFLLARLQQRHSQRRSLLQIERPARLLARHLPNCPLPLLRIRPAHLRHFPLHLGLRQDHRERGPPPPPAGRTPPWLPGACPPPPGPPPVPPPPAALPAAPRPPVPPALPWRPPAGARRRASRAASPPAERRGSPAAAVDARPAPP